MGIRCRAFTLAELLVVTSIIAILASLAAKMALGAKADAKKATCAFNLRQMSVGINTYLQDFDDQYPQTKAHASSNPAIEDADGSLELPDRGHLLTSLRRYGTGVADCPNDPDLDNVYCSSTPGSLDVNSYLANAYFLFGLNQMQVATSGAIIIVERRNSISKGGLPPNCDNSYHPWFNPTNPLAPRNDMDEFDGATDNFRHTGGSNYLFADGHARWYEWGQTYSPLIGVNFHKPN